MTAKIISKSDHWEIHLYNSEGELTDRFCVTTLEMNEKEECHVYDL